MTHVRQSVVGVVIFINFFLHDPANAEKRAQFGQYWGAVHMHAFYKNLRYAFLTKFDQYIRDMTTVIVLKWHDTHPAGNSKQLGDSQRVVSMAAVINHMAAKDLWFQVG